MRVNLRRALPAAVCAGALLLSAGPAGAITPSATVTPHLGLTNGQTVTVKWKGFNARKDKLLAIVQCNKMVATDGANACDTGNAVLVSPGTKAGTASYTVHTGAIGTDGQLCGTKRANLKNCVIAITGLTAKLTPVDGQNAVIPIAFKAP